jgi:hypothetical protein
LEVIVERPACSGQIVKGADIELAGNVMHDIEGQSCEPDGHYRKGQKKERKASSAGNEGSKGAEKFRKP